MKAFVASIAICVLFATGINSSAEFPDRVFPFVELTDEDVARIDLKDVSVEDWLEIVGEPSLRALNLPTHPERGSYDPSSFDFRVWLAWHEGSDRFYLAAEIADDVHIGQFNPEAESGSALDCVDPSMHFLIDGDQSGGIVMDPKEMSKEIPRYNFQVQSYYMCADVFTDGVNIRMSATSWVAPWVHLPPFADGGGGSFSEHPTISVIEFYVTAFDRLIYEAGPDESEVSGLFSGKRIKFALSLGDLDISPDGNLDVSSLNENGIAHNLWGANARYGDDTINWGDAEYWAHGILVGHDEDTAVRDATWGRIKASLSE